MKLEDLKKWDEAPASGQMMIYTRREVIFRAYEKLDQVKDMLKDQEILEVHLFDEEKEYRAIRSESRRFPSGVIEHIVCDKGRKNDEWYDDATMTEDSDTETLIVRNYLTYDEHGMVRIDDYRLRMGVN